MKKPKEYKRLPGKKRRFLGYNTIWLGPGHILSVHSTGYSEDYKRFYYGDIQAFITRKTARAKIISALSILGAGLFILLAVQTRGKGGMFLGILGCLFLIILLVNLLRGPTCTCHIQTPVQTEKLPSLHRFITARKVISILRPLIERAQGRLT